MNELSSNDRKKLDDFNSMSIGDIFRKARESHGLNVAQISAHLNIGTAHLEAIEANDVNALPPKVYAVGFVRAYADLLGLDSEKMAYLFKVQVYGRRQTEAEKEIIKPEGKTIVLGDMISSKLALIPAILGGLFFVALVVGAIIFLIAWLFTQSNDDPLGIPDVPVEMMEQSSSPEETFVEAEIQEEPEPAEPTDIIVKPGEGAKFYGVDPLQSALTFKLLQDNWMEIRSVENGKLLISKTLKAGDVFHISETQDVLLTTGNAGAIEAYLDGQKLGLLGAEGDIIRLRPFSVESLRLNRQ